MVMRKLFNLTDLIKAQAFYIYTQINIVIVNNYKNFILANLQMVLYNLKNKD